MMKSWFCECGQEVVAVDQPSPLRWKDGHVCHFYLVPAPSGTELVAQRELDSEKDLDE